MEQYADELHKGIKKIKNHKKVQSFYRNNIWGADLADMTQFNNDNDGFKFILGIIDIYTRFVFCVPLKNKSAESVANGFKYIFDNLKIYPKALWVDQGKEFYNSKLDSLRSKYNIDIYSTYGTSKSAIIERFFRTLKSKIFKLFTINQNHEWINGLNNIVDNYNKNKNRGIENNKPKDMMFDNIRLDKKVEKIEDEKTIFKIGDRVRISYKRGVFDKGYLPSWSVQIYKINSIKNGNPPLYIIEDEKGDVIKGSFYKEELQATKQKENIYLINKILETKGKGKNKKALVSWVGYDSSFNTWEPYDEVVNDKKFEQM